MGKNKKDTIKIIIGTAISAERFYVSINYYGVKDLNEMLWKER